MIATAISTTALTGSDYWGFVVQFIDGRALVTYLNIVEDEPGGPGAWKADMTWADILVNEDGKWKYELIHLIDFRDLTTPDQKNEKPCCFSVAARTSHAISAISALKILFVLLAHRKCPFGHYREVRFIYPDLYTV